MHRDGVVPSLEPRKLDLQPRRLTKTRIMITYNKEESLVLPDVSIILQLAASCVFEEPL